VAVVLIGNLPFLLEVWIDRQNPRLSQVEKLVDIKVFQNCMFAGRWRDLGSFLFGCWRSGSESIFYNSNTNLLIGEFHENR
jgi:hypothetical protein